MKNSKKTQNTNTPIQIKWEDLIGKVKSCTSARKEKISIIEKVSYFSFFSEQNEKVLQLVKSKNSVHFQTFKVFTPSKKLEQVEIIHFSKEQQLVHHHSRVHQSVYLKNIEQVEVFLNEYFNQYFEKVKKGKKIG